MNFKGLLLSTLANAPPESKLAYKQLMSVRLLVYLTLKLH